MILKGSQRSGGAQLADHLMNDHDNEHITVHELRGFSADNLRGAFKEVQAISMGTQCKQYLFSLSLNPPKEAEVSERDFEKAADRIEKSLGLDGQARAIVFHEKEGRRHAHVVWSRIDGDKMRAINISHFKNKLRAISRELYLENNWELPNGLKPNSIKNPLNYTLAEWQQAKRQSIHPKETKRIFQDAWKKSDGQKAVANALAEYGFFLAKGDKRGFVAVDVNGEIHSIAKALGLKNKDVRIKLGDAELLPNVGEARKQVRAKITDRLKSYIQDVKNKHKEEFAPLEKLREAMRTKHRTEREHMHKQQNERWRMETEIRAKRVRTGFMGLVDKVTGKAKAIKQANEIEAVESLKRDQKQRDWLSHEQMREKRILHKDFEIMRARQMQERKILARDLTNALRQAERLKHAQEQTPEHAHTRKRGFSLDH